MISHIKEEDSQCFSRSPSRGHARKPVQTRVGLLTDDPLEVKVVPVAPPSSRAVTRLPRLLTAVTMTPDRTDD